MNRADHNFIINVDLVEILAGLTQQFAVTAVFSDSTTENNTEEDLYQFDGPITMSSGIVKGVFEGEGTIAVTYHLLLLIGACSFY